MISIKKQKDDQKDFRMINFYEKLIRGESIRKRKEAERFQVTDKTIQRDVEGLRDYLEKTGRDPGQLVYDRENNVYKLVHPEDIWLSQKEVLAIAKVLLESRAFPKNELEILLDKLSLSCSIDDRKEIREILANERHHYIPVKHNQPLFNKLWDFSRAKREQRLTYINYQKVGSAGPVERLVEPWGVIFSEYYFYLVAYIRGKGYEFPAIFRLDRILDYRITDEHFRMEYGKRFEEGEMRKRIQFMQSGKIQKITFKFWGESLEAVLDRLPTAEVIGWDGEKAVIRAEVFGRGIKMWLLSQAEFIEVIEPEEFRGEMRRTIEVMNGRYKGFL